MTVASSARIVVSLGFSLFCACSNPVGVYRGTTMQTFAANGASSTTTITGDIVSIFASAEANALVFEAGGVAYTATRSGESLTFPSGQSVTVTETNGMSSRQLTSGSGTLTATSLTLNLSLLQNQTAQGQTTNVNVTVAFNGQKI